MPIRNLKQYLIHIVLFLITLLTTTLIGAEAVTGRALSYGEHPLSWLEVTQGLWYSVPFLAILTAHEFGHYFAARFYKVDVSLPYYIPIWLGSAVPGIGSMGAFIRLKSVVKTRQQIFDIGIAGPLAGFVVALGVLWYGFSHLPPPEYIFTIHPDYAKYGLDYAKHVYNNPDLVGLQFGDNLVVLFFKHFVVDDPARIPHPYEITHFPLLFAGYIALFFTALNLLPVGQLDGGHILYGLVGFEKHAVISRILFVLFVFYAGIGVIGRNGETFLFPQYVGIPVYLAFLYLLFNRMARTVTRTLLLMLAVFVGQYILSTYFHLQGYHGWLVFSFILGRFLGVYHPPAMYDYPLSRGRKWLGWLSLLVFITCFSPQPFIGLN
jgi:membrane-associated protease RseP (regulator of RpoE activity)